MNRPFMRHRIDQLENFFGSLEKDPDGLQQLETELTFRQNPRAIALLAKVRKLINGEAVPSTATARDLFEHRSAVPVQAPLWSSKFDAELSAPQARISSTRTKPIPELAIEDAYRILRVTAAATWETIESNRRQIVDRARPDAISRLSAEKRSALELEAANANAAYAVIARTRNH